MAAAAVSLIGIGAVMTLNQNQFRILKSTQQVTSGTLCMQERVEAMRIATWRQLTDPSYLANTLLATAPKSASALGGVQEQITVSAYPNAALATSVIVKKVIGQTATVVSAGSGLSSLRLARVDLQIQWTGSDAKLRTRETSLLISNGGISLVTLPGFGSAASGVSGGAPTPTPAPIATPTPTGGGTSPTPTPTPVATPTPTPTPSGNGNGVGRGNVSNPSGKK